jgi:hypothetical protein
VKELVRIPIKIADQDHIKNDGTKREPYVARPSLTDELENSILIGRSP